MMPGFAIPAFPRLLPCPGWPRGWFWRCSLLSSAEFDGAHFHVEPPTLRASKAQGLGRRLIELVLLGTAYGVLRTECEAPRESSYHALVQALAGEECSRSALALQSPKLSPHPERRQMTSVVKLASRYLQHAS